MKHLYLIAFLVLIPFFGISQTVNEINEPLISGLDEVSPFHEGFAAVRKGNQWGFINEEGQLSIAFRNDVLWNEQTSNSLGVSSVGYPRFNQGLCIIFETTNEGVALYGFMNTKGETVIAPEFVNIAPFEGDYTVGIYARKDLRGKNEFQLDIYDYTFTEVLVNKVGEMVWPVHQRQNIIMAEKRFKLPELHTKLLSNTLLAVKGKDNSWKVVKLKLEGK